MGRHGEGATGGRMLRLFRAHRSGVRLTRALRRQGLAAVALQLATHCSPLAPPDTSAPRVAAELRGRARLRFGFQSCLFESVYLCGALRRLGYDACLNIGAASFPTHAAALTHAWVEVLGKPVSESPAVVEEFT